MGLKYGMIMALNRIMVCECRHPGMGTGIESERILKKRQILLSGEKNKLILHGKEIKICSLNAAHKFMDIVSSLIARKGNQWLREICTKTQRLRGGLEFELWLRI